MYQSGRKRGSVRLALRPDPSVRAVHVAGSFNNWQPLAMKRKRDGTYVREVPAPASQFEYKFLVDGQWIMDPDTSEWAMNPYGTCNSVARHPQ